MVVVNLFPAVPDSRRCRPSGCSALASGLLSLDDEVERWLLFIAGVFAIFASYYAGRFLHNAADRMQRRPKA